MNDEEILQVRGLGEKCQAVAFVDSSFKIKVAEFLGFYERGEFRSHSFTTTKKGKGIGVALLGLLDLSIVELFK